jgi:hypothetical protein
MMQDLTPHQSGVVIRELGDNILQIHNSEIGCLPNMGGQFSQSVLRHKAEENTYAPFPRRLELIRPHCDNGVC